MTELEREFLRRLAAAAAMDPRSVLGGWPDDIAARRIQSAATQCYDLLRELVGDKRARDLREEADAAMGEAMHRRLISERDG